MKHYSRSQIDIVRFWIMASFLIAPGEICVFITITILLVVNVMSDNEQDSSVYPSIESIRDKIGNKEVADLWTVGLFIAAHKYFGVDWRYQTGKVTPADQVFHKKFPKPVLKAFHHAVEKYCEESPRACVDEVLRAAIRSGSLKHLLGKEDFQPSAPFRTNYEIFQYRQTASYYLCWYTMKRSKVLQYVASKQTCLADLSAVEEIPEETRKMLREDNMDAVVDPRNNAEYYAPSAGQTKPFVCAELWFCPDPCYGRESHGNYIAGNKDPSNPCSELKDDTCAWKDKANQNFDDLIRNKFNITCNCSGDQPGFEWNSKYELCVDKDECYDGSSACQGNRICKNSVGSYICTCPKGYEINTGTNDCEKMTALHQSAKILDYKPKGEDFENGDFIDDLMDFVGISTGHMKRAPTHFVLCSCLSYCVTLARQYL